MIQQIALRISILVLFFSAPAFSRADAEPASTGPVAGRLHETIMLVRDGRIRREEARKRLRELLPEAREAYYRAGGQDAPRSGWYFPVAGRDVTAITGGRRHGYVAGGYDFFAGNRHGGHPSLDIFIRDRNRDCLDDTSGNPVPVLAMTGGVVVSAEPDWETGSRLRGGRYLWIYDPGNDLLVYYAHNDRLLVRVGDIVRPGDVIATVGRTGFNAEKRRSPTHLHLTVLRAADGGMLPVDVYPDLRKARLSTPGGTP